MDMRFVDMHCDTLQEIALPADGRTLRAGGGNHIDIEKMRRGGGLLQVFALFIRTNEAMEARGPKLNAYDYCKWLYRYWQREMAANADEIAPVLCWEDFLRNREAGRMSALLSIEDSAPLDGRIERVEEFHGMGVRMMSLTWNYENSLAFPNSTDPEIMARGLKPFGIEAVRRMNELGIVVDVSHLSDGGFWDVVRHTDRPFVASHSDCRALREMPRNLTDEMLRALADRGGVAGLNFYASFLHGRGDKFTALEDLVRHARHMVNVAGIDAVGLGSDFDGIAGTALEFGDYAGLPMLADALSRHFTDGEVEKICSGNVLRVLRDVIG